ncbi:recombinase family protein [Paenibacillus sp. JSM ZJ436]|uniref:recombinase family protein n=1 Tax=Paenibacillus sp. JSM ZJ436 TaxID=3376190 RepID=UPI0037B22238
MQKKLVVVYTRVSSGSQNLREQKAAAKNVLEMRNINEEDVLFLEDFNVSATKNNMKNRPNFNRLLRMVSEDKVATIIIYARDRAYRNFYEGSQFNDLVNLHNVEVVYTASNSIPFHKNSSIESFYGIFAQQEGKNIGRRTDDARKRFPGETIGYERIEQKTSEGKKNVKFFRDYDRSHMINSLFEEFSQIQTKTEFVDILSTYGKKLSGHAKVMKILQRPFYAAHCITDYGYDQLNHVEPIITLELFEKAQVTLQKFVQEYEDEVARVKERIIFQPICGICNNEMKFKKMLNKPSYFVCGQRHKQIAIELDELNQFIEKTILNEINSFTLSIYEPMFRTHLKGVQDKLLHQKQHNKHLWEKSLLLLASADFIHHGMLRKHSESKIQHIEDKIDTIDRELVELRSLEHKMTSITSIVPRAIRNLTKSDLEILIELLIKEINIHHDYLEFNMYSFASEQKGVG